jgi:hypothetical protein
MTAFTQQASAGLLIAKMPFGLAYWARQLVDDMFANMQIPIDVVAHFNGWKLQYDVTNTSINSAMAQQFWSMLNQNSAFGTPGESIVPDSPVHNALKKLQHILYTVLMTASLQSSARLPPQQQQPQQQQQQQPPQQQQQEQPPRARPILDNDENDDEDDESTDEPPANTSRRTASRSMHSTKAQSQQRHGTFVDAAFASKPLGPPMSPTRAQFMEAVNIALQHLAAPAGKPTSPSASQTIQGGKPPPSATIQGEKPPPSATIQGEKPPPSATIQGGKPPPSSTIQGEKPPPSPTIQGGKPPPSATIQGEKPPPSSNAEEAAPTNVADVKPPDPNAPIVPARSPLNPAAVDPPHDVDQGAVQVRPPQPPPPRPVKPPAPPPRNAKPAATTDPNRANLLDDIRKPRTRATQVESPPRTKAKTQDNPVAGLAAHLDKRRAAVADSDDSDEDESVWSASSMSLMIAVSIDALHMELAESRQV